MSFAFSRKHKCVIRKKEVWCIELLLQFRFAKATTMITLTRQLYDGGGGGDDDDDDDVPTYHHHHYITVLA